MKKKFLVLLMVLALSMTAVFAGEITVAGDGGNGITLNSITQIVILCTGIIPGALIAIKFMLDIVSAYYHREQDPSKLQKAIVNFIIVVIIVIGYVVVINFIFSGDAQNNDNSQASNFLAGLTAAGAEVPAEYALPDNFVMNLDGFVVENVDALLK